MIQRIHPGRPEGMVEVAPNRYVQLDLNYTPPETVFCDVVPVPGEPGKFTLKPRTWEKMVRVTAELSLQLGLESRTDTLRRLIRSGFVDGARVSPRTYTLNVASYFAHFKRCAEDPDFWTKPQVLKEYYASI